MMKFHGSISIAVIVLSAAVAVGFYRWAVSSRSEPITRHESPQASVVETQSPHQDEESEEAKIENTPIAPQIEEAAVVQKTDLMEPGPVDAPYKQAMTTYFWVGEGADASNDYISNHQSYWDEDWLSRFGGIDDPRNRCGYRPCGFIPRENPFYFALPYGEYGPRGLKDSARNVPWFEENAGVPLLKNRWIEVKYGDRICYGQWEDVGPNNEDDFDYVFGSSNTPTNSFGAHAGLDISPALWDCLGMTDNSATLWRFIEESMVPEGPWKERVTASGISWEE